MNRILTAVVLGLVSGLAGCASSGGSGSSSSSSGTGTKASAERWSAPTTYKFAKLSKKDAPKVEQAFKSERVTYQKVSDSPLTYEVKGLSSAADVTRVNKALSKATGQAVETAQVSFGGSDGGASGAGAGAYTQVEVKVSPGATAYVADGAGTNDVPWRRIFTDKSGVWKGLVNTRGVVQNQSGWLYIAATKDGHTRFYRLNTSSKMAESLSYSMFKQTKLPDPAGTVRTVEESGGFKWPWEG